MIPPPPPPPLVSIIMPVYNGEEYLAAAIDSILAQTYSNFELVVVDDGSEDGSAEVVRAHALRDGRIRFFQLEQNRGEAAARGHGVSKADGEFVTFLDSDDLSLPERLQKQVEFLQAKPEFGGVGTHAKVVDADLKPLYDRRPPAHHALILFEQFIGGDPFVHASIMLRRELFKIAGNYDTSLRYGADGDLLTRLMGRARFSNIPECLYICRRHGRQLTAELGDRRRHDMLLVRARRFERLWGEAPKEVLDRVAKVRPWSKLSWRERRAAKRDLTSLIDSLVAAKWVEPGERPLLVAAMNRRLEQVSPRLWQMFCHWRRHRFGCRQAPPGAVSSTHRV